MPDLDAVPEVLSVDLPAGAFLLDVREHDEWVARVSPSGRCACAAW